jgi:hypothetical protein
MGDSISEGTVVEWLKGASHLVEIFLLSMLITFHHSSAPGDRVEADEVVVVLETDKVGSLRIYRCSMSGSFPCPDSAAGLELLL